MWAEHSALSFIRVDDCRSATIEILWASGQYIPSRSRYRTVKMTLDSHFEECIMNLEAVIS